IREFTDAAEELDITKEITSILTMPYITADGDSIYVADLVDEDFSGTPDEIAELKRRLASWEIYEGQAVSPDTSATQIVVSLNAVTSEAMSPEVQEGIRQLRGLAQEMFTGFAKVYVTGDLIVTQTMDEAMNTDLGVLIPLVILVILVVLFLSFRHFTYIALPLLTVILSVIWTIGAMPLFGVKLSVTSIIMPIILIAVGSAYGIHVVSHYIDETKHKILTRVPFSSGEHRALVFEALRKVIKPVLLAALTTMAGFISFVFTILKSMQSFGIFSCIGVGAAMVISLTLIPALFIIRGPRVFKQKKTAGESRFGGALANVLMAITRQKAAVITVTILAVAVSLYGFGKLVIDNAMVEFFRPDTDIYQSDAFIRKYFGGTSQITVAVEANSTEELLHPRVLAAVDNLNTYLTERVPLVNKVSGFTDMVKRMNQMFNVDESPQAVRASMWTNTDESETFGFDDFGFDDVINEGEVAAISIADPTLQPPSPASGLGASSASPSAGDTPATPPALADTNITFAMLERAMGQNSTTSARDMVRELQRQTNYEGRAYYEIPADPARYGKQNEEELTRLISNYLVLVGDDSDDGYANDPLEPTAVRSVIQVNSKWWADSKTVIAEVNNYIAANFPDNVRVTIGGGTALIGAITDTVTTSQIVSIFVSILIVFVILAVANKSIAAGILGAVPLSIAIVCNFGIMGFLGITLNMGTALVASLAVGIGIDYTIHVMEFFKLEYRRGGTTDSNEFLRRTFSGCGKAILINAVSVGAGFAVLALSNFRMITHLGGLIASSMFITAIVSLTLMPVLIMLFKPRFIFGKSSHQAE
ncbi:MAG: MMPL family transporter, partial [Spirochaetaceae bacterium]|nr:MMPL family transporter [Spirochaetaceae bacterium]